MSKNQATQQGILQEQVEQLLELTRRLKTEAGKQQGAETLLRLINAQCRVSAALLRLVRQISQDQPEEGGLLAEALERYWKQAGGEEKKA
mgnify:CR=1 FL=1